MNNIEVIINGISKVVQSGINVSDLIKAEGIETEKVAVAIDMELVPRSAYKQTVVQAKQNIEILSAVQGG